MIHACKLYIGPDQAFHVAEGNVGMAERVEVVGMHCNETPAHSSLDWRPAPKSQYVVTLSDPLEFTTGDGETFILRPGDVLAATDDVGSGHRRRLIGDQPWRRGYTIFKCNVADLFVPGEERPS